MEKETEFRWSIASLHFIARETEEAMLMFGKFLGAVDYKRWNWYYGVHIHYQSDAHYGEGLTFIG